MIKVVNKLKVYEVNDEETNTIDDKTTLVVESHWNERRFVVLKFNDIKITISADDLESAIKNATNTNK